MIDLYSKWGNYIPQDIRKQFESEWLEIEKLEVQNKELHKKNLDLLNWVKSELRSEINPKLGKTMTAYRGDKIRFLNRVIDCLNNK